MIIITMSVPKKIIQVLGKRNIGEGKLEEITLDPMGDDDIRYYYPKAKILTFPELRNYSSIEALLPKDKSYVFLLFLQQSNSGHWTLLSRNNGKIEFFCSYGNRPEQILKWTKNLNSSLGQNVNYLQNLFNKTNMRVVYNPHDYQDKADSDISTCGRHDCFRLYTILKYNFDLDRYFYMMSNLKRKTGDNYDQIVSEYLPKM